MLLIVDEPELLFEQALFAGATEIYPITNEHGWPHEDMTKPESHRARGHMSVTYANSPAPP